MSFVHDKAEDDLSLDETKEDNQNIKIIELEQSIEGTKTDSSIGFLSVECEEDMDSVSEINKVADLPVLEVTTQEEESEEDDEMWIAPV